MYFEDKEYTGEKDIDNRVKKTAHTKKQIFKNFEKILMFINIWTIWKSKKDVPFSYPFLWKEVSSSFFFFCNFSFFSCWTFTPEKGVGLSWSLSLLFIYYHELQMYRLYTVKLA